MDIRNTPCYTCVPEVVDITATSCILTWNPVADCDGYFVYMRNIKKPSGWWCLNNIPLIKLKFKVMPLEPGGFYQFSIAAQNKKGKSVYGKPTDVIEAVGKPK